MPSIKSRITSHPVVSFFVFAYVITWTINAPVLLFDIGPSWTAWGLFTLGALGPFLAATIVLWAGGQSVREWFKPRLRWRVPLRWYVAVVGIPVVFLALGTAMYGLLGYPVDLGVLDLGTVFYLTLPLFIVFEAIVGGGKEELGWRGFALPRLQARYGAAISGLLIGIGWALWHLPMFFTTSSPHGTWPLGQQVLWGVSVVGFSLVLTWLYNETGSVWIAMLGHGAINILSGLVPIDAAVVGTPFYEEVRIAAIGTFAVAVWIVALVLVVTRGADSLSKHPATTSGLPDATVASATPRRAD
ncbi:MULTISPECIES: CPBP family intramembrane glutamic endopeptidase [Haloferax]|uniref:CPBP family intramembrane metalloprotease n=1 Tax=Haloferax marinum TaxID=2666143 RepID=A0A6A8G8Q4_9EURY|nr:MULTISPECIES: type II CAAX endopeptidase family protein [Haloferax]KAB1198285.1 CPBP family intramembrane metalloprotease [Haloferax sp. CBA1150]MRW97381.1 CPBP family intramembrane metalloprotease [Haloferax marinum]